MKPAEYIGDLFEPDERIAVVLVSRERDGKTKQRIWSARTAASEKVQRWLKHENAHGSDIYVSMNPLRAGARSRRKRDVAEVRRVYLDLDENGRHKLRRVLQDGFDNKLPMPCYLVNTSEGRYQAVWNVKADSLSIDDAEQLMRGLTVKYGGDPAATDVSRVLRLPGFKHRGRGSWVTMSATGEEPAGREDWPERLFRLGERDAPRPAKDKRPSRRSGGGDRSPSGRDWGESRERLRAGEDRDALKDEIRLRRQDKHNPADYAHRTVERAAESLELER